MKLLVTVFWIYNVPILVVLSTVQLERVIVYDEYAQKMLVAVFSRMQEPSIIKFPHVEIVPYEPEICVFLRMLQLLISYFAPVLYRKIQVAPVTMLSVNEENEIEQVTVLESTKG